MCVYIYTDIYVYIDVACNAFNHLHYSYYISIDILVHKKFPPKANYMLSLKIHKLWAISSCKKDVKWQKNTKRMSFTK